MNERTVDIPATDERVRPLSGARLLGLGAIVVGALALLGLASRGLPHHRDGRSVQPVSAPHAFDYLLAFAVTAWVVGLIVSVIQIVFGRRKRRRRRRQGVGERELWRPEISQFWRFAIIAFVVFVLIAPLIAAFFLQPKAHTFQRLPTPVGALIHGISRHSLQTVGSTLEWMVPIAVVLLAGLLAYVVLSSRGRRAARPPRRRLAHDLVDVLDESLDDIEADPDPRHAVVRSYARMERVLDLHGLPRRSYEAPFEYLARVLQEVKASGPGARRLTELYERARFSTHEIDSGMKEQALAAVRTLRGELEAAEAAG